MDRTGDCTFRTTTVKGREKVQISRITSRLWFPTRQCQRQTPSFPESEHDGGQQVSIDLS